MTSTPRTSPRALAALLPPPDVTALALALGGTRVLSRRLRTVLGPSWAKALSTLTAPTARALAVSLLGPDFFALTNTEPAHLR